MSEFSSCSRPLALNQTVIKSNFWVSRMRAAREGALPAIWERMKETGRWDVLKLEWREGMPNRPHHFWDSDVAKWTEAACYALTPPLRPESSTHKDSEPNNIVDDFLASKVTEAVSLISGAKWEDGYINSYFTVVENGKRWTNIAWMHEHYCAGHLLEAAIAHHTYVTSTKHKTDQNALLDPLLKYIAHIYERFGPDISNGQKRGYPGHQELELALLRLYEHLEPEAQHAQVQDVETVRDRALSLASFFIHERGHLRNGTHYYDYEAEMRQNKPPAKPGPAYQTAPRWTYNQANAPISSISSIEGHSVRAGYWLTAAAHLARVTKDHSLLSHVNRLWESMVERKMHITGGLGAIGDWEGFGPDYYFPNESAYLETCASIALIFVAHQMLLINPMDVRFGDTLERALYNGALVGMSLDGKTFFYDNPLATVGKWRERTSWFDVSCCPPNLARLLNSLGKYVYTHSASNNQDIVYVHLLIDSEAMFTTHGGRNVRILQESNVPWSGDVLIRIEGPGASEPEVIVRVPDWTDVDNLEITASGYIVCRPQPRMLRFSPKSCAEVYKITLQLSVKTRLVHPHPLDTENHDSVAIARGPFIYCLETVDNSSVEDLRQIRIPDDIQFDDIEIAMPLGPPVVGLKGRVRALVFPSEKPTKPGTVAMDGEWVILSRDEPICGPLQDHDLDVKFIPYFAWANRGRSDIRVWIPRCSFGK